MMVRRLIKRKIEIGPLGIILVHWIILSIIATIGLWLGSSPGVSAGKEVPTSYKIIISSGCGDKRTIEAVAHAMIFNGKVLSINGKDRRRYLISMEGVDIEFSNEVEAFLPKEQKS